MSYCFFLSDLDATYFCFCFIDLELYLIKLMKVSIFVLSLIFEENPLAVGLSYYVVIHSFNTLYVETFYRKRVLNFVKCLFCIYWGDHIIYILHSVNVIYHIYCFVSIEPSFYHSDKYRLIMACDPCPLGFSLLMSCWIYL